MLGAAAGAAVASYVALAVPGGVLVGACAGAGLGYMYDGYSGQEAETTGHTFSITSE